MILQVTHGSESPQNGREGDLLVGREIHEPEAALVPHTRIPLRRPLAADDGAVDDSDREDQGSECGREFEKADGAGTQGRWWGRW